jgi:hypothetical protein
MSTHLAPLTMAEPQPASLNGDPLDSSHVVRLWRWQPRDLIRAACRRLPRNLGWDEWQDHMSGTPYHGEYGSAEEARAAGKQRLRELEQDQTIAALHLKRHLPGRCGGRGSRGGRARGGSGLGWA